MLQRAVDVRRLTDENKVIFAYNKEQFLNGLLRHYHDVLSREYELNPKNADVLAHRCQIVLNKVYGADTRVYPMYANLKENINQVIQFNDSIKKKIEQDALKVLNEPGFSITKLFHKDNTRQIVKKQLRQALHVSRTIPEFFARLSEYAPPKEAEHSWNSMLERCKGSVEELKTAEILIMALRFTVNLEVKSAQTQKEKLKA